MRFTIVLAVALAAAPLAAQDGGTRIRSIEPAPRAGGVMPAAKEARVVMANFGACVLKVRPAQAGRWMRAYPEGRSFQRAAYDLAIDDCLGQGQLGLNASLLRASLWMAAYRRDFRRAQPAYAATDPDWAASVPAGVAQAEAQSWTSLRRYAACVIRAVPALVHAMLTAMPGSPDEDRAFTETVPALGACLPAGETLKLNRLAVSALLAEAAYRLAEPR